MITPERVLAAEKYYPLSFDGVDDYVDCGNNGIPIGANPFTKEVQVYLPNKIISANYKQDILWWGTPQTNNKINCLRTGDNDNEIINYFHGNDLIWISTHLIDGWNYITITYDGNIEKGYVNKVHEASYTAGAIDIQSSNVFIAKAQGSDYYFNNPIGEVRIYNRALSEDEIKQLYYHKPILNGLVLWTQPQRKYEGTLWDKSGKGNHGTIYGATPSAEECNARPLRIVA